MIFKPSTIAAGIAGVAIVALITYFNPMSGQGTSINLSVLNIGLIIYVFIAAMFAISAMVLPGISGSTLLLIFGLYVPIISAVKSVITFDFCLLTNINRICFGYFNRCCQCCSHHQMGIG